MLFRAIIVIALIIPATVWASLALFLDGPSSKTISGTLAATFVALVFFLLIKIKPFWHAGLYFLTIFALLLGWWLSLEPSNDRNWRANVARLPQVQIDGDQITVQNLRNFDHLSENEYVEHWEARSYDLSKLRGADMFLSYWGSPWIAHTIASWDFGEGNHLAISIETRKEKGESYSALRGFFREFELYYVVADERDIVRVRTNYRKEDVYLYRLKTSPEIARNVLLDYIEEINRLAEKPRWYNALTHNCTTMIRHHIQQVAPGTPFDWRVLVNGKLDELGYERNNIDNSLPFEELRHRSNINEVAMLADKDADFSARIRAGLPRNP